MRESSRSWNSQPFSERTRKYRFVEQVGHKKLIYGFDSLTVRRPPSAESRSRQDNAMVTLSISNR
jgi:hypothetical protein